MLNNNYSNSGIFSNPFSSPFQQQNSNNSIEEAYKKLELLKSQQDMLNNKPTRTVFNDIIDEWNSISDDERAFIESSKEYQSANNTYQQEFNAFLIEYLGRDFLNSPRGVSAEKVLATIRERKETYKNKFANDIQEIKERNTKLEHNNEELNKNNLELQRQLEEIRNRLSIGGPNE